MAGNTSSGDLLCIVNDLTGNETELEIVSLAGPFHQVRRISDHIFFITIIIIIIITRPWPAFGRQGLVGSSFEYSYTRLASRLRRSAQSRIMTLGKDKTPSLLEPSNLPIFQPSHLLILQPFPKQTLS